MNEWGLGSNPISEKSHKRGPLHFWSGHHFWFYSMFGRVKFANFKKQKIISI